MACGLIGIYIRNMNLPVYTGTVISVYERYTQVPYTMHIMSENKKIRMPVADADPLMLHQSVATYLTVCMQHKSIPSATSCQSAVQLSVIFCLQLICGFVLSVSCEYNCLSMHDYLQCIQKCYCKQAPVSLVVNTAKKENKRFLG